MNTVLPSLSAFRVIPIGIFALFISFIKYIGFNDFESYRNNQLQINHQLFILWRESPCL